MPANVPVTTTPPPISMLTNPLALVAGVCVSTYTGVPVADPCSMLMRIPTVLPVTSASAASLTTAW
jgi:hypothetical protein